MILTYLVESLISIPQAQCSLQISALGAGLSLAFHSLLTMAKIVRYGLRI
jgi:hypothetical protein